MRICIVTPKTSSVRSFREDLVKTLSSMGHEVFVLGEEPEGDWTDYFSSIGASYHSYFLQRTGTSPLADIRTYRSLKGFFDEVKPDLVFNYFAKPNIYGAIAARRAGVAHVHDSVEGLGSILGEQTTAKGRLLKRFLMLEYKYALKHVDKCFFVNEDNRSFFVDNGLIPREKTCKVNGVGVNLDAYPYTPLPNGKPTFLFCGRLIREKGIMIYVEAARLLKSRGLDADFLVLGGLDTNPSAITIDDLQEYIDDGSIIYCGETEDVVPYFQKCWIYSSSSYGEGLPKTGMEAMSIGRGLVMTDCVGNRDLVVEGPAGNGTLVPCDDVEAFAEALADCAQNRERCEAWGAKSRLFSEEIYDVRIVNKALLEEMGVSQPPKHLASHRSGGNLG